MTIKNPPHSLSHLPIPIGRLHVMPASLKSQLALGRQELDLPNRFLEIFPLHRSIQVLLKKVPRPRCLHLEWQPGDTNQSRFPSACCEKGQSSTLLPRGTVKVSTEAHPQKRAGRRWASPCFWAWQSKLLKIRAQRASLSFGWAQDVSRKHVT